MNEVITSSGAHAKLEYLKHIYLSTQEDGKFMAISRQNVAILD
jgi:hypothetical protein